jgi:hypothetical protein
MVINIILLIFPVANYMLVNTLNVKLVFNFNIFNTNLTLELTLGVVIFMRKFNIHNPWLTSMYCKIAKRHNLDNFFFCWNISEKDFASLLEGFRVFAFLLDETSIFFILFSHTFIVN